MWNLDALDNVSYRSLQNVINQSKCINMARVQYTNVHTVNINTAHENEQGIQSLLGSCREAVKELN